MAWRPKHFIRVSDIKVSQGRKRLEHTAPCQWLIVQQGEKQKVELHIEAAKLKIEFWIEDSEHTNLPHAGRE